MRHQKGSRRIVVRDIEYRWRATGNDGYISIGIWPTNNIGRFIQGNLRYHEEWIDNGDGSHSSAGNQVVVTNRIVRRVIEHAIASHDYDPRIGGCETNLGNLDDAIQWDDAVRGKRQPLFREDCTLVTTQPTDLLDAIRRDPYKLLGQASLGCLRAFIDGYGLGVAHAGKSSAVEQQFQQFKEWATDVLGAEQLSVSAIGLIIVRSADESQALNRFFELWDEYTNLHPAIEIEDVAVLELPDYSFEKLLASVEKRPGMFLGRPNVSLFQGFQRGYQVGVEGTAAATEVSDFDAFSRWLSQHHRLRDCYRWDRLLLLLEGSEEKAFTAFFPYFAEFRSSTNANL